MYYYRTQHGVESDIVLVKGITPVACIEIKFSSAPQLSKGFYTTIEELKTKKNFVITPDTDEFSLRSDVQVCSLITYLEKYVPKL